jgi:hypothetical protein
MSRPRCRCPCGDYQTVSVVSRRLRYLYEIAVRIVAEYVAGSVVRSPHRASRNVHALPVECVEHAIEIHHQKGNVSSGWPGMLFCQQKVDLGLAAMVVYGTTGPVWSGHRLQSKEPLIKTPGRVQITHHQADVRDACNTQTQ